MRRGWDLVWGVGLILKRIHLDDCSGKSLRSVLSRVGAELYDMARGLWYRNCLKKLLVEGSRRLLSIGGSRLKMT